MISQNGICFLCWVKGVPEYILIGIWTCKRVHFITQVTHLKESSSTACCLCTFKSCNVEILWEKLPYKRKFVKTNALLHVHSHCCTCRFKNTVCLSGEKAYWMIQEARQGGWKGLFDWCYDQHSFLSMITYLHSYIQVSNKKFN